MQRLWWTCNTLLNHVQGQVLVPLTMLLLAGCAGTPWGERFGQAVAPGLPELTRAPQDSEPLPPAVEASAEPDLDNESAGVDDEPGVTAEAGDSLVTLVEAGVLDEPVSTGSIRRSEFVRWLVRAHNIAYAAQPNRQLLLDREATPYFLDVPEDHPDFRYIQALTHAGYVEVPEARLFQPELILTRVLLIDWKVQLDWQGRLSGVRDIEETWGFLDSDKIPSFARDAVAADFEQPQLIQRLFGPNLMRLEPQAPVSRAEAASALMQWGLDNQPLIAETDPATVTPIIDNVDVMEESPNSTLNDGDLGSEVGREASEPSIERPNTPSFAEETPNEPPPAGFITPRD